MRCCCAVWCARGRGGEADKKRLEMSAMEMEADSHKHRKRCLTSQLRPCTDVRSLHMYKQDFLINCLSSGSLFSCCERFVSAFFPPSLFSPILL